MVVVRKGSLTLSISVAVLLLTTKAGAVSALPLPAAGGPWAWYPIQQGSNETSMVCMNGTATGLGISMPSSWNNRVLIWMAAGGVCDDATSCAPAAGKVIHQSYSSNDFQVDQTTNHVDLSNCPNCNNTA